jgi:uridine kinase
MQRMFARAYGRSTGATIIIAEGIMALLDPVLRELYDMKVGAYLQCSNEGMLTMTQIFVQCDSDLMLARRIKRDTKERGRTVDGILEQSVSQTTFNHDHLIPCR